jgi:hypothetical protein
VPLSALVARIDAARVEEREGRPISAARFRVWLFRRALSQG